MTAMVASRVLEGREMVHIFNVRSYNKPFPQPSSPPSPPIPCSDKNWWNLGGWRWLREGMRGNYNLMD